MKFEEKTVKSESIYNGKVFSIKSDDVLLPNGKMGKRDVVLHHGGSSILCVLDNKILFVKQYRYSVGEELLEIPAGKLNAGENPQETAFRELQEECGLKAKKMQHLFTIYPSPGYTSEKIYIYKAEDVSKTDTHLDDDEFLASEWIEENKVKSMLDNGEITDGKTVIALLHYFESLGK